MLRLTVSGQVIDVRSDHLLAVVDYALQQAADSQIPVLDVGDNEQALSHDEQLEYLANLLQHLRELTTQGHSDLLIVMPD